MQYRKIPRLNWLLSEVGYGMWGLGGGECGWIGCNDDESLLSLNRSMELGCNFFDTAWIYGRGHSEVLLGKLKKQYKDKELFIATKIPPKNRIWPSNRESRIEDVFPEDHIFEYTEKSLENLQINTIDLQQFHVWEDKWVENDSWKKCIDNLKSSKMIKAVGISINRWEPWNVIKTLSTGLIDTVQLCYNIFDQSPDDALLPLCKKMGIGVIARTPFDEGVLIGNMTEDTVFPEGDWRNTYFVKENLIPSVQRVNQIKSILPPQISMAQASLKFVLDNEFITTVIPGMRKVKHVDENMSNKEKLPQHVYTKLKGFRWDRTPTFWSQ